MYPEVKALASFCRERSDAFLVVGGVHATAFPELVLKESMFDFVVLGEGELTLLQLTQNVEKAHIEPEKIPGIAYRDNGEVKYTGQRNLITNLDYIPLPPYQMFYRRRSTQRNKLENTVIMISSRGCPHKCIFCANGIFGQKVRYFSAERVADELEYLKRNFGFTCFNFVDDNFLLDRERVMQIFELLDKRNVEINWHCQSMLSGIDYDFLVECKKLGCQQISYGLESGDKEMLARIRKHIRLDEAKRIMLQTRMAGIRCVANVIIGFPWETTRSLKETIRFIFETRPHYVEINIFTPMPGSDIWEMFNAGNRLISESQQKILLILLAETFRIYITFCICISSVISFGTI